MSDYDKPMTKSESALVITFIVAAVAAVALGIYGVVSYIQHDSQVGKDEAVCKALHGRVYYESNDKYSDVICLTNEKRIKLP